MMNILPWYFTGWFTPRWPNLSLKVVPPKAWARSWLPKQMPNSGVPARVASPIASRHAPAHPRQLRRLQDGRVAHAQLVVNDLVGAIGELLLTAVGLQAELQFGSSSSLPLGVRGKPEKRPPSIERNQRIAAIGDRDPARQRLRRGAGADHDAARNGSGVHAGFRGRVRRQDLPLHHHASRGRHEHALPNFLAGTSATGDRARFLRAGGGASYFFHYLPWGLSDSCDKTLGTFALHTADRRNRIRQPLAQFVAVHLRHLDVEEHEVGREVVHRLDRLEAVAALADDRDALGGAEILAEQGTRIRAANGVCWDGRSRVYILGVDRVYWFDLGVATCGSVDFPEGANEPLRCSEGQDIAYAAGRLFVLFADGEFASCTVPDMSWDRHAPLPGRTSLKSSRIVVDSAAQCVYVLACDRTTSACIFASYDLQADLWRTDIAQPPWRNPGLWAGAALVRAGRYLVAYNGKDNTPLMFTLPAPHGAAATWR